MAGVPGAAEGLSRGGGAGAARSGWKRHIIRALKQRDRRQKASFQDVIQAYNRVLENTSFLQHLTGKIQTELTDPQISHTSRSPRTSLLVPNSLESLHAMKEQYQEQVAVLQSTGGELAYKIIELNKSLVDKDGKLEEQEARVSELDQEVRHLEASRKCLQVLVDLQETDNAELKEGYDTMLKCKHQREEELRIAVHKGEEALQGIVKKKEQEAVHRNNKNEREKKIRISKVIKKATEKTVSIDMEREDVATLDLKTLSLDIPEPQDSGKTLNRAFRSASATMLRSSKFVETFKDLFDFRKRRVNSMCSQSENLYPRAPVCVAATIPSKAIFVLEAHDSEVNGVKFSPSSKLVATGGADRVIKLWNVIGGRLQRIQDLEGCNSSITSVEFSPSGSQILAASADKAAHLWKLDGSKSKDTLTGHNDKVTAAKFKSVVHQAVTGSMDRTVKEWDLHKGACLRSIKVPSFCTDVVCSDYYIISGHHDKKIRFWDSRVTRCTEEIPVQGKVTSLNINPEQTQLLSCSRDDTLKVIDLRMNNVRQVFRADGFKCGGDLTRAIFSPDGNYAIAGSADGALFIWNVTTGHLEKSLQGMHSASVNAVAWSLSGEYVVSVDRRKMAVLWSAF
ncbi:protein Atg16l2 [Microcaecilia unicolor]|uniref:Protein Atg16l2 n=1 Tax=Microcaecilia unicolor TaxID=1415580 RepID=A0A6P7XPV2_9AMPH|nr:autophagy-related protein 16-2 [Microcaecilia unicolor]